MENIYLIGLMGAGKTSVGKLLAKKLHLRYVDTDAMIEKKLALTVREIFSDLGEAAFRREETLLLQDLATRRNRVVSTGGGIVLRPENVELMRRSGKVVWLQRDPQLILKGKRINRRPLLAKDPQRLYEIAGERLPLYEKACHFYVDNNGERHKTLEEIVAQLWRKQRRSKKL